MNDIKLHKEFHEIITSYSYYIINNNHIDVNKDPIKIKRIEELGFKTEKFHDNDRIILEKSFRVYENIDAFLVSNKIIATDNILILEFDRQISFINEKSYINFNEENFFFLFSNSISYLNFLKKLKELEEEIDGSFHFIDSYNRDTRKITLVSLAEKSRLNINYENSIPFFNELIDYKIGFEKFNNCFNNDNKNLSRFLKTTTINTVINYNTSERIKLFFENLDSIVYKAKVNFEVYLNELSLDKVKKEYDDVKTKYFNNLSEVLSKLTTSILTLPIGIATLLFSIEKLKEIPIYLYLLIAIILTTSLFLSSLLKINYTDLLFTKKLLNKDYKTLIENNFFTKYEEEKNIFDEVKKRITRRIDFLKIIVESYFWLMNISNLFIIGLILYYLKLNTFQILIPLLLIFLIIGLLRNYSLEKDEEI